MNRVYKLKIVGISLLTFVLVVFVNYTVAQTSNASPAGSSKQDFIEKLYILILGGLLGFVFNLILDNIKRRREAQKQLTYSVKIERGIPEIPEYVKSKVSILYNNQPIKNLAYVLFDLENTGNRVVTNHYIRLEFTEGTKLHNLEYTPEPEREMDFKENNTNLSGHERGYNIGYIKPGKRIGFRFIVEGVENKEMVVAPYDRSNNNDDVSFVSGAVRRIVSDQNKIKSLLGLGIIYIIVPSIFDSISPPLSAVIRAILLMPMLWQVDPFINLVAAILTKFKA